MCTPLPEWEIPADWQPQPIIFRKASFNQPEYKLAPYSNAFSEPQEWNLEQRSQDSDNDGDMFSLIGSSPADSNKHGQAENEEVETLEAPRLVGKSKNIHDIKSHQSCSEFEDLPHLSVLEHRFTSYRPILACNSSGWYALAFSYFEILLHPLCRVHVDEEIARISSLNNLLKTAGQYEIRLIQHKINETVNLLKDLSNIKAEAPDTASHFLLRRFNHPDVSSAIICHFRLIASSWLAAKSAVYVAYLPEGFDINSHRDRWLDAPQKEIEALGLTLLVDSLLRPLGVGFELVNLDEPEASTRSRYSETLVDLNDNDSSTGLATVHLLRRHNHYDILYTDAYADEEEIPEDTSNALPQETPREARAEFGAYSHKVSFQNSETRFVRDLPAFAPRENNTLMSLADLCLSESRICPVLGINGQGQVLEVHTSMNQRTFEPKSSSLTGLADITAFAENEEREEAIIKARQRRLKETEPKGLYDPSTSATLSASAAGGSSLRLEHTTNAESFQLEHIEPIALDEGVLKIPVGKLLRSQNNSGIDDRSDWGEEGEEEEDEDEEEKDEEEKDEDEDDEDEEEFRDMKSGGCFFEDRSILKSGNLGDRGDLKSFLDRVQAGVVDCLMKDFWGMANQIIKSSVKTHGSPTDSSGRSSETHGSLQQQLQGFTPGKRSREEENDEPSEQDGDRGSKKPKSVFTPLDISEERPQFACPYRKHDPRKYNVNEWAACALTPREGVARVKSHLYLKHRIHQCPRCRDIFETQGELDRHIIAPESCDVRASNSGPVEGITARQEEQLRCRKKLYPGQTQAERWQQVYQLLFPNEIAPDPYFEPVRDLEDNESQFPESLRLEEHLRREVPRIFRNFLDVEVNNGLQSLEEHFKSRLSSLVQAAQDDALKSYRSASQASLEALARPILVESQSSSLEHGSTSFLNTTLENIFGTLHQPTPGEVSTGQPRSSNGAMKHKNTQHHSSFDSGYHTDSWEKEALQHTTVNPSPAAPLAEASTTTRAAQNSMEPPPSGAYDSFNDEVWPFHSGIVALDDPLNFQAYGTWSQQ